MPFSELDHIVEKSSYNQCIYEVEAIGDHIRKKRIDKNLLQEDVAKIIGVTTDSITNWENKRSIPVVKYMPGIIKFLGYVPMEIEQETLGGKILKYRYLKGMSCKKLGAMLQVDSTTVRDWEINKRKPHSKQLKRLLKILSID